MSLYLYLNEHWHANTWVNGGVIPINPASFYRSTERAGIMTPDENLIHNSPIDLKSLEPNLYIAPGADIRNLNMIGTVFDGVKIPDIISADYYEEDGLILSFSTRLTGIVARKMTKKACVKIKSVEALKRYLDAQLGVESIADYCQYTTGHQRNHFLKSDADSWQAEFRIFWPIAERVEVDLPFGVAELICNW